MCVYSRCHGEALLLQDRLLKTILLSQVACVEPLFSFFLITWWSVHDKSLVISSPRLPRLLWLQRKSMEILVQQRWWFTLAQIYRIWMMKMLSANERHLMRWFLKTWTHFVLKKTIYFFISFFCWSSNNFFLFFLFFLQGQLLHGQVAIITGSGQGIGAAAAKLFASQGAKVVVSDLDEGMCFFFFFASEEEVK